MDKVSNASAKVHDLAHNLYDYVENDGKRHLQRNYEEQQDARRGKHDGGEEQQSINCTGGSQHNHVCLSGEHAYQITCNSAQSTGQKVEQQKLAASYGPFKSHPEHEYCKHVEEQMRVACVDKHVGHELPHIPLIHQRRNKAQPVNKGHSLYDRIQKVSEKKNCNIGRNQISGRVAVCIIKFFIQYVVFHLLEI